MPQCIWCGKRDGDPWCSQKCLMEHKNNSPDTFQGAKSSYESQLRIDNKIEDRQMWGCLGIILLVILFGSGMGIYEWWEKNRAPIIESLNPKSGSIDGGTILVIHGTRFTEIDSVTVGGAKAHLNPSSNFARLEVITPAAIAGPKTIVVTKKNGTSTSFADAFTYGKPPKITSVTPSDGWTKDLKVITIKGTNLSGATVVEFNGFSMSFIVVNDTCITIVPPTNVNYQIDSNPFDVTTLYGSATFNVPKQGGRRRSGSGNSVDVQSGSP